MFVSKVRAYPTEEFISSRLLALPTNIRRG